MNRITWLVLTTVAIAFGVSIYAKWRYAQSEPAGTPPATRSAVPQRIISMAPNITETLFALGLGDKIVGVTRFCTHPPAARKLPKIGGYIDPNYESIVSLGPDLIILFPEHARGGEFEKLGLSTLVVDHNTLEEILQSIETIGEACGAEAKAERIVRDIRSRMARVEQLTADLPRPKVLLCVDRDLEAGGLKDIYIIGHDEFFSTLLELAGATNAYTGKQAFPTISSEAVLQLDPDVIIDLTTAYGQAGRGVEALADDWRTIKHIDAVANDRIYIIEDPAMVRPGPGFIEILERFVELIHPEAAGKLK